MALKPSTPLTFAHAQAIACMAVQAMAIAIEQHDALGVWSDREALRPQAICQMHKWVTDLLINLSQQPAPPTRCHQFLRQSQVALQRRQDSMAIVWPECFLTQCTPVHSRHFFVQPWTMDTI